MDRDYPTDSSGYIINEAAAAVFHYKNPIGQPLTVWGRQGKIIGLIKDFHITSLHEKIPPVVVRLRNSDDYGNILVRIDARHTKEALASLEDLCATLNPQFQFTWYFTDDQYRKQYESDVIVSQLSTGAAVLAIFISCMGLLGLAMFSAQQRTREIGIRKVLGAGVTSLLTLLSGEFVLLVGIALIIASPLAWWAMQAWLRGYAYPIRIEWWFFALARPARPPPAPFSYFLETSKVPINVSNRVLLSDRVPLSRLKMTFPPSDPLVKYTVNSFGDTP